jgi:hypothetical protein
MNTYEEAKLEIETLKRQLAEANNEIKFLKTELVELKELGTTMTKKCNFCKAVNPPNYHNISTCWQCCSYNKWAETYIPEQEDFDESARCSVCDGVNPYNIDGTPYCYSCCDNLWGEKYCKTRDQACLVKEDDEEEGDKEGDKDDEEEEEVEDRRQTHIVKEPWKSMSDEREEEEVADKLAEAVHRRKYLDEQGEEYDDECWYEAPIKTITVKQMMLALDKLPRNAQLVITEEGFYSCTEFAAMMLPEPYAIQNKIPRLPDGTQVYRIGHSRQNYDLHNY